MSRRMGAPTTGEDPTFAHGVLFFARRDDLRDVRSIEKWLAGESVGRGEEQRKLYDDVLERATKKALAARQRGTR